MTVSKEHLQSLTLRIYEQQDPLAMAELYQHFAERLQVFLRRRGMTPENAEDIVNSIFLSCWRAMRRKPVYNVSTFLHQAAKNSACNSYREAQRLARKRERLTHELTLGRPEPMPDSPDLLPLLEALNDDQRQILVLYYWEGLNRKEIAAQLGIPVMNVNSRLRRAKAALRPLLEALPRAA